MGNSLEGRVAIVTGGGGGIGTGVSLTLAEEGAKVVVNDLGGSVTGEGAGTQAADVVVRQIEQKGGTAVPSYDSVAEYESAGNIIQTAINNFGRLDIVIHTAGILRDRMLFNMTEYEWDGVLQTHLKGAFNMVRQSVPHMIRQHWGRILLYSSGSGLGNSGQANYAAAKEGMVGFARALSGELAPFGITANAIYPGGNTRMTQSVPDTARTIREERGIGGAGGEGRAEPPKESRLDPSDPFHNAAKTVYLCTDAGANITGQVIGTSGLSMSIYGPRHVSRTIHKNGRWTLDELDVLIPASLTGGIPNPAPAAPPADQRPSS